MNIYGNKKVELDDVNISLSEWNGTGSRIIIIWAYKHSLILSYSLKWMLSSENSKTYFTYSLNPPSLMGFFPFACHCKWCDAKDEMWKMKFFNAKKTCSELGLIMLHTESFFSVVRKLFCTRKTSIRILCADMVQ